MVNHNLMKHRERAEQLRSDYNSKVVGIQQDRDLNEAAKQRRLAEAYTTAKARLDEASRAEQELLSTRWRELQDTLFGAKGAMRGMDVGGHAISARDASDRAAQVQTPAEAADLLARAEADGDELLARAVARRCAAASEQAMNRTQERAWDEVTGAFIDNRPILVSTVEELAQIENMTKRQVFSPFAVMQPHGLEPAELNRVGVEPEAVSA